MCIRDRYEISFKTSAGGSLEGGSDTITVTFPRGTTVPDSISRSDITVNGETLDSRSVSISGRKVTVRVPSDVSVGNNLSLIHISRLNQDYARDIALYDQIEQQALMLSLIHI